MSSWVRGWVSVLVSGAVGCGPGGDSDETKVGGRDSAAGPGPLAWDLEEPGPYGVGYRSWSHTYVPGDGLNERTVRINLWYPSTDLDGDAATYTVGSDALVMEEASLAASPWSGGWPVHLHSHGSQGYGATSAFLARHFASHGWVFVAPDHTDNTLLDNKDPRPSEHYVQRPLDLGAALDALDEDAELGGRADTAAVLLSGHSFGVYTTWAALGATYDLDNVEARCDAGELGGGSCHEALLELLAAGVADERVVAALPMAGTGSPSWFGDTGQQSVSRPVMLMSGSEDEVGQAEEWERVEGLDYTWVELEGGCHQSFALGACETLDPEEGFRVVRTLALAFGRVHLLGDAQGLDVITGESSLGPHVEVRVK